MLVAVGLQFQLPLEWMECVVFFLFFFILSFLFCFFFILSFLFCLFLLFLCLSFFFFSASL